MSVTGHDSLKTRRTLNVDGKLYDYFSLDAAAQAAGLGDISRLPFSLKVLLENLVRLENGRTVSVDDIKAVGAWLKDKSSDREIAFRPARVLMQDLTGVPAVVDLAAMRAGDGRSRRRPEKDQPAVAGRSGHRPFGADRQFRLAAGLRRQREEGVRAQRRALPLSALGPGRVRQFPPRAAGHRHLPSGQSRIPVAGRVDDRGGRPHDRLSRHAGRHRQPHDDGQRVVGARLGGRRHRGRGGDARPADLDAAPGGRRLPPRRQIARGRDRDRSRADRDADAAAARRGRQVCRVLRPRNRRAGAGRPRDDRQHGAGIRRDLRLLPDRRRDDPLSDDHRARPGAGQAGRGLCQGAGSVARREHAGPGIHRHARTRSFDGRAVACRAAPAAGPGGAVGRLGVVRRRIAASRRRGREAARSNGSRARITNCTTATS